jgi:hypothetical protein
VYVRYRQYDDILITSGAILSVIAIAIAILPVDEVIAEQSNGKDNHDDNNNNDYNDQNNNSNDDGKKDTIPFAMPMPFP